MSSFSSPLPPSLPPRSGIDSTPTIGEAECLLLVHNVSVTQFPMANIDGSKSSDLCHQVKDDQLGTLCAHGTMEIYSLELRPTTTTTTTPSSNILLQPCLSIMILSVPAVNNFNNKDDEAFQVHLTSELTIVPGPTPSSFTLAMPINHSLYRIDIINPDNTELECFIELLAHYTNLNTPNPTLRNTVALVGPTGRIIGTLADSILLDTHQVNPHAKGPVIISQQLPKSTSDSIQWTVMEPSTDINDSSTVTLEGRMVATSEMIGDWLIYGAGVVSDTILRAGVIVKENGWITPNATPLVITPTTRSNIQTAKNVTEVAVKATGAILSGAATFAVAVGSAVASRLQSNDSGGSNSTRSRSIKLTSALIQSLSVLGDKISSSGLMVLKATGQGAATLIEHKYGTEAGSAARELTQVAENVWMVYFDSKGFRRMVVLMGAKGTVNELAKTNNTDEEINMNLTITSSSNEKKVNPSSTSFVSKSPSLLSSTQPTDIQNNPMPSTDNGGIMEQMYAYAQSTAPKVAAAVSTHAPRVAAAVAQHGPKVTAAVSSSAMSAWAKVSEQMYKSVASNASNVSNISNQSTSVDVRLTPNNLSGIPRKQ